MPVIRTLALAALLTAPLLLGIPVLLALADAPINRTAWGFGAAAMLALGF